MVRLIVFLCKLPLVPFLALWFVITMMWTLIRESKS